MRCLAIQTEGLSFEAIDPSVRGGGVYSIKVRTFSSGKGQVRCVVTQPRSRSVWVYGRDRVVISPRFGLPGMKGLLRGLMAGHLIHCYPARNCYQRQKKRDL